MRYLKPIDDWPELKLEQPISIKKVEEQMDQKNAYAYTNEDEKIKTILKNEPDVAVQIITSWLEDGGDKIG
jgi:flagellar biosynthesis/type III secretory pathway M-ring protein FliF/YscJ